MRFYILRLRSKKNAIKYIVGDTPDTYIYLLCSSRVVVDICVIVEEGDGFDGLNML